MPSSRSRSRTMLRAPARGPRCEWTPSTRAGGNTRRDRDSLRRSEVSLESRDSVSRATPLGHALSGNLLGGLTAVQITILVDELAVDPDAARRHGVDLMSYTREQEPEVADGAACCACPRS